MNQCIARAVELVGSQAELARRLECSQVFVNHMLHGRRAVPARFCLPLEAITDGVITRYDLCPEVFGEGPDSAGAGRAA